MNRQNLRETQLPKRLCLYLFGLFLMTTGIAFSVMSDLGVSPLSTLPYAATICVGLDMGVGTTVMHAFFVLLQIILLRKRFRPIMLLQIPAGIVFGLFTTLCNNLVGLIPHTDNIIMRLVFQLVSIVFVAVGIHFYLPANIMPLAGEGIVSAISETFRLQFPKVKIGFDCATVIVSAVICLTVKGTLGSVGIGTVMSALLTGTVLAWIKKLVSRRKKVDR